MRVSRHWAPVRIAYRLRLNPSTVHKVLVRYGAPPLAWTDPATGFWTRANAYFTSCGITVKRVLTDNGSAYRSMVFAEALGEVTCKRTRPYRPQINGKVKQFNQIMDQEWAYARPYRSGAERGTTFPKFLHTYNYHRGHTALKGASPTDRAPNLSGQNT